MQHRLAPLAAVETGSRRSRVLLVVFLIAAWTLALLGVAPTAADARPEKQSHNDKCIAYYFLYTDGTTDAGEVCDSPGTPPMDIYSDTHGINAPNLHVSCSDTYSTAVVEDGEIVGYDSDGTSDLGGRLIAVEHGVGQWGISKSWTGDDDCGLSDLAVAGSAAESCTGTVIIEVREETVDGALVPGAGITFAGHDVTLAHGETTFPDVNCGTHEAELVRVPDGYSQVDGDPGTMTATIETDGQTVTVVFLLTSVDEPCVGEILIEVRDVTSGDLVSGSTATIDDEDAGVNGGQVTVSDVACDRYDVALTELPEGYVPAAGARLEKPATISEDGTTVRVVFWLADADLAETPAAPDDDADDPAQATEVFDEIEIAPPSAPDPADPGAVPDESEDATVGVASELPRTGMELEALLLLTVLLLAGGATMLLGLRRDEKVVARRSTNA